MNTKQLGDSCLWPASLPLSDTAHIPYLFPCLVFHPSPFSSNQIKFPEPDTQESQPVSSQRYWKKGKYAEKFPSSQTQWPYSKVGHNVIDNTDTS